MSDKHIQISYSLANILFYRKITCIFHHLRIFVVQICRRHLRTFSANFVWPEKETPPIFSPLECMHQRRQTALENKETRQNNRLSHPPLCQIVIHHFYPKM